MVRSLTPKHLLPFSALLLDSCCRRCVQCLHLDRLLQSGAGLWCNIRQSSQYAALRLLSDCDNG